MLRLFVLALSIAAQVQGADIPLDPAIAFGDLADHYRRGPRAERIEVRAVADGQTRAEPVLLQIVPPGVVQLTIGDLTAWSDSQMLRITHRLDEQGYFEAAVEGRDVLSALEGTLPPLPLPQLALAFGDDPAGALTAYAKGVRWSSASLSEAGKHGVISIEGSGDRVEASLKADATTGRVLRMLTSLDSGRATIEITTEVLEESGSPRIGFDLERRTRVKSLGDFRARGSKVVVGDVMPALRLTMWIEGKTMSDAEPEGPAALVLIRRWKPGVSPRALYQAADRVLRVHPGFKVYVAIVFEPGEPNESAIVDGVEQEAAPRLVHRTFDAGGTIERFTASTDQVLVVIDGAGTVRAVEPLKPGIPGAPIDAAEVERSVVLMMKAFEK